MVPFLLQRSADGSVSRHVVSSSPFVIGRHSTNALPIDAPWLSRYHASIEIEGGQVFAMDRSAAHHTYVNGRQITREVLRTGDRLVLGNPAIAGAFIELEFGLETALDSSEPVPAEAGALVYHSSLDAQLAAELSSASPDPARLQTFRGEIERTLKELRTLHHISRAINSELVLERVLDLILEQVLAATGADKGFLMLRDPANGALSAVAARDVAGKLEGAQRSQLSLSICQRAVETGQTLMAQDTQAEPDKASASMLAYDIRSVVAVPMSTHGEVVGVLYFDAQESLRTFTPRDIEFFDALATQSAIAIQNARAYERIVQEKKAVENQVRELKVQFDAAEQQRQVDEISESEYFVALRGIADQIRDKF